ncbi:MAG: hypothetical protein WC709_07310 [Thermoleophilia bacterium]
MAVELGADDGMGVGIVVDDGEGMGLPIMPLGLLVALASLAPTIGTSTAAASATTARAVSKALSLSFIR